MIPIFLTDMQKVEFKYVDGFVYDDMINDLQDEYTLDGTNDILFETEIDAMRPQANMAYVDHMGWAEDFDSLSKADEDIESLWVDGKMVWTAR